jgi:AsmA-like C-terminal region/AsmA family
MKKILKWSLIVLGSLVVLIVAIAIIIPIVFKDDIKAAIDKQLASSVNADVVYDIDNLNITLFRNFPNLTVEMESLGVINREPFANEVLFATEKFGVEVNLFDVLFGSQLKVKGISIIRPIINIKVLKDGRANYDIAIPSTDTTTVTEETTSNFSFGIEHWEIVNGKVEYDDQSMPYYLVLKGLNHNGSGNFTQDVFDLTTYTSVDTVTTSYGDMELLTDKRVEIDAVIQISEAYTKYTFKENKAKVNDFAMAFDGWFKMNENDFGMDISFSSPENTFKSLLSLVPVMYTKDFGSIETKGDLAFNGFVKGTYSDTQMPAFNLGLLVKDAMFKYPDLPIAVNNINVDMLVDNKDGVIENTSINIKKLHLDFGTNPFDASLLVENLRDYRMKANLAAKLNLAELTKMFPMDGLELRGNYAINLKANGVYDSIKKIIPAIDASMSLANGFVKSNEFPLPIQDLHFSSTIKNTSGKMAETTINVNDLALQLDGEKFTADMMLQNLDNYTWDVKAKGGIDLEKITKIFPLEGMNLAGKVQADIRTQGKMSYLEAEKYDKLPTSGTASLKDFKFTSKDLPYAVTIAQAGMVFDPKKIDLTNTSGTIGKSDFSVSGSVSNYLGYVFGENETIKGNVAFASNLLDLNEFMTETEETTTTEDTASFGVIAIPNNIDFLLHASVKTAKMMDFNIANAKGDVLLKDGVANMRGLIFNMLGGSFGIDGTYNTKDVNHPKYDLALKIDKLSIQESANSFSIVKTYAPIAGLVNGNFSTDFKINGELTQDMMPNMATVNAAGLIKIAQAALKDSKLVSGITSLTKLDNSSDVTLKDVLMSATIKDGKLSVKPFDVNFGNYKTTIAGSTGLDGAIDYQLKMNVPANKVSSQLTGFVNQYTGSNTDPNKPVPITIGVGGKYNNPTTKLLMSEQKQQVKEAATAAVKEETAKKVTELAKGTEAEKLVNSILGGDKTKTDTTKKATTPAQEATKKVQEEATKKIQNLLKKKKN